MQDLAKAACNVVDLSMLVPGDDFTGSKYGAHFEGSANYCKPACISAVATLVRAWGKANCDYGGSDYGHLRSLHLETQARQFECASPREGCVPALTDFLNWKQSDEGQNCSRQFKHAEATASAGSSDQQFFAAYCEGSCAAKTNAYLNALHGEGCNAWPAYLAHQEEHEVFCSTGPRDAADNAVYCHREYLSAAGTIHMALDASQRVATRETALVSICTDCFRQIQTLKMQNFEALGRFSSEPELCIQDVQAARTYGSTYKFCLPKFEQIEANYTVDPKRDEPMDYPLATLGSLMCTDEMGRCAERIWAHRLAQWTTSAATKSDLTNRLKYSCLEGNLNGESKQCNSVSEIRLLEAGSYTERAVVNQECNPNSISGECLEPRSCQSWDGSLVEGSCRPQCQTKTNAILLNVGCCYESWKYFMGNYSGADASANFARVAFLANACCDAETGASCSNSLQGPCGLYSHKTALAVTVANVPYSWVKSNRKYFNVSIVEDIARILGVLDSSITLSVVEEFRGDQTKVAFLVGSSTSVSGNKVQRSFERAMGNSTFAMNYTAAQQTYRTRCQGSDFGNLCSSASLLRSSTFTLALAVLTAMALAF